MQKEVQQKEKVKEKVQHVRTDLQILASAKSERSVWVMGLACPHLQDAVPTDQLIKLYEE